MNFHDSTHSTGIAHATTQPPVDNRGKVLGVIGIDLVLPFATYYGLRLFGADRSRWH